MKTQKDFNNGKYLALVLGPFGQISLHASDFAELVAQSRALLMMRHRKIKAGHAYGLCRAPVLSRTGLAGSLGWVRLILDRFRDAACPHPDSSSPLSLALVWASFNFEYFGCQRRSDRGFWPDADNQARERLVLEFVLIAFAFGVSCLRFSYNCA